MSADGGDALRICGPPGIVHYIHAYRHFVRWVHPKVFVHEEPAPKRPVYDDDNVQVFALVANATQACPMCAAYDGCETELSDLPTGSNRTHNPVFVCKNGEYVPASNCSPSATEREIMLGFAVCIKEVPGSQRGLLLVVDSATVHLAQELYQHPIWK